MNLKFTAGICGLLLSAAASAQNGWLPPVYLPGTSVCDPAPYRLVLYDEFKGNQLSSNWITYTSGDYMSVVRNGDTVAKNVDFEQWGDARRCGNKALFTNGNVTVQNDMCRILLVDAPNTTWTYVDSTQLNNPTVSMVRNFSTGQISTPYHNPNGSPNYFNSGKFEARIRFPDFKNAWCAFWLWAGTSVNELDMAEEYGAVNTFPYIGKTTSTSYNLHAWAPGNNPYNLPYDNHVLSYKYPHQGWWDWLTHHQFKTNEWHLYTCEWDTAVIKNYLDYDQVSTIWKYSKQIKLFGTYITVVGSGCNPAAGNWGITYGYPWNSHSECQLRIGGGFGDDIKNDPQNPGKTLGTLDIDYVAIWQRHPELDGHKDACNDNTYPTTPAISGPNQICGAVAYTLSPATNGTWSSYNPAILNISSPTSTGASVAKDAGSAFNGGYIYFSYGNGIDGCPLKSVYKSNLYCNQSTSWQVAVPYVINNIYEGGFHFISNLYNKRDVTGGTTPVVEWDVSITKGQDTYNPRTAVNYTLRGEYASVPYYSMQPNDPYNLKWTMKVTDASGTYSRSGERNSQTPLLQQKTDPNTYYVNAYIDDQNAYDNVVLDDMASQMISEDESNDALFTSEMVEKAKANALEPYIIWDQGSLRKFLGPDSIKAVIEDIPTKVFPNPVQSQVMILPGAQFSDRQSITLNVYDLPGKLVKTAAVAYQKGNTIAFDLSDIPNSSYILELKQGAVNDHIKLLKTGR